jgi:hypothetical protein
MELAQLQKFYQALKDLKNDIAKEPGPRISKAMLRQRTAHLATTWFSEIIPELAPHPTLTTKTIATYSGCFEKLLKLTNANNLKTSYLKAITAVSKTFHDELILPIRMEPKATKEASFLSKLFANLASPAEDAYMKEAIACASHELYRGSAVLGWCAAIDRIHRVIEKIGYDKFNATSQTMKAATSGRFKKFSCPTSATSMNDLLEVFDSNILWILEGMQLIDSNQHTRLKSCFDLRNQCSHPGEAPVTEYNLASFFSDINEIIFKNPRFALPAPTD